MFSILKTSVILQMKHQCSRFICGSLLIACRLWLFNNKYYPSISYFLVGIVCFSLNTSFLFLLRTLIILKILWCMYSTCQFMPQLNLSCLLYRKNQLGNDCTNSLDTCLYFSVMLPFCFNRSARKASPNSRVKDSKQRGIAEQVLSSFLVFS